LKISVYEAEKLSLEQIRGFILASEELRFESENRIQRYAWVERVLIDQEYARQGKVARGMLRRYIERMTGMSRSQVTRLVASYSARGQVRVTGVPSAQLSEALHAGRRRAAGLGRRGP
jgi:hypothetical protein